MTRLVEGNSIPGNRFSGDDLPPPAFCPVCGNSKLERWSWTTVEGDTEYPSLVCYGRTIPPWKWLYRRFSIVTPTGAHYEYQLPQRTEITKDNIRYSRQTGEPI